jgi:hypothetical protein
LFFLKKKKRKKSGRKKRKLFSFLRVPLSFFLFLEEEKGEKRRWKKLPHIL